MICRQTMTSRPPTSSESVGLEDAAFPSPRPQLEVQRSSPVRVAGFVLLFLLLSLLAFAVFLAITVGVTVLVGMVVPGPAKLAAPILGVGVASLGFGAASRLRKGRLRGRYGLLRRPPRDPFQQRPGG